MSEEVKTQRGDPDPSRGAYERSDMDARTAGLTIGGLAGLVVIVAGAVFLLFLAFGEVRQPPVPVPRLAAPAPALQTDERRDRAALEAPARARLKGRDGGAPIAEGMRRTAALGWDAAR
jgi:hypothetical protein